MSPRHQSRRDFLLNAGHGFGSLALSGLLQAENRPTAAFPNKPPKAKRVIQLFMNGGVSQMDTFDPKPKLAQLDGTAFDPGAGRLVESATGSPGFKVLKSPFEFRRHGHSGRWVSSVFPHIATVVDELAFLTSMSVPTNVHGIGSYFMNTGFSLPGHPCLGAWLSYGLGRISENLPDFVVLPDPDGLPYNNLGNFSSGFLPAQHTGTVIDTSSPSPIPFLKPPPSARHITPTSESASRDLLAHLNHDHRQRNPGDSRLDARLRSYQLAANLQLSAPELFDLSRESTATKKLYGVGAQPTDDFARRCLLARRMAERGVRFVQLWSGAGGPKNNWDNHANIHTELPHMASQVDQPVAALITDLKSRGLLDDTLVIFTTEFGRMPFSQGQSGRDHNGGTFVSWLAGGGVEPGTAYGQSDPWGWKAEVPITCHDFYATVLHLLGIDHETLTVRHNGIDKRLTDVHGTVIRDILA